MARKRTGSKEYRSRLKAYVGRVRDESGERTSWQSLGTDDPDVAQERLDRWVETGEPPRDAGKELFRVEAERIVARQEQRGEKGVQNRRHRLETFAFPVIGHIAVSDLAPHHVYAVLSRMGQQEGATRAVYAADTVHHLRTDISRVLTELVHEGALTHNVARDVELPDDVEVDDRPRIVLTDEEVMRFRRRGFDSELDMMALFARDCGGHRTSDLHAADYVDFDTANWEWCVVRRPKTDREGSRKGRRKGRRRATRGYVRVKIRIPESVVGPLQAWREKHRDPISGELPVSGPIFPLRRGPNTGQRKTGKGISYAQPLRDALWDEGIVRPLPGYETAVGEERRKFCALQVDTDETRAVDFHSFRRAFVTALAKAGVNSQTAMGLAGHADMTTHMGYYVPEMLEVPAAALPGAPPPSASTSNGAAAPAAQPSAKLPPRLPDAAALEGSASPTSMPGMDAATVAPLAAVLTQLLGVLQGSGAAGLIDPRRGSNADFSDLSGPQNPQGYPWRARLDSNQRPTASEGAGYGPTTQKDTQQAVPQTPVETPLDPALTRDAGQSPPPPSPPPSLLEQLRATAKAAFDVGNWALFDSLRPLIEAEEKRAKPPVQLDAVRKSREAK